MKRCLVPLLCLVVLALAPAAHAATCGVPADDAPKADIAGWMAQGASAAGLPGELPVMASLTDTGLTNLSGGDRDSVGYFDMRVSIWNTGAYAGFPDNPALQLQWFIDQALIVERQRIAEGDAAVLTDPAQWGEWECRNNRLAWLGLVADGFNNAVAAARERYGAERIAVVIGTSTASIGASEDAYRRLEPDGRYPADLRRPIVQFVDMRTSAFGTVQQAPSASMKTTHSNADSGP